MSKHPLTTNGDSLSTTLQHPQIVLPKENNPPLVQPIFNSVKYEIKDPDSLIQTAGNMSEDSDFFYTRAANPTVRSLELELKRIQTLRPEDYFCVCLSSGMAALSHLFLSLLGQGDHVVLFYESYKPGRVFLTQFLKKFGVTAHIHSLDEISTTLPETLKKFSPKVMLIESPSNPTLKIAPLDQVLTLCKQSGVISVLDNTFAGPHQHREFSFDFFVHSLTKFVSGHGDAMGGAIIGKNKWEYSLRMDCILVGATLDPFSASTHLRGLKTLMLRYQRQSASALTLAQKLESHPKIERVFYPGLPSHPHFQLAKSQMTDSGGLVCIQLKPTFSANSLAKSLRLFRLAASLGSTDSLIIPVVPIFSADLEPTQKKQGWITEQTLRLSVGLEDPQDLISDFEQALNLI